MPTRGTGKTGSLATSKLGERLKSLRMTKHDLARRLGIHRSTVGPWFKGKVPHPDTIQEIAKWSDGVIDPGDWFKPPPPKREGGGIAYHAGGGKTDWSSRLAARLLAPD
jgi:transcriptional regulator with XRE-family HTH domain